VEDVHPLNESDFPVTASKPKLDGRRAGSKPLMALFSFLEYNDEKVDVEVRNSCLIMTQKTKIWKHEVRDHWRLPVIWGSCLPTGDRLTHVGDLRRRYRSRKSQRRGYV
jgi:hypothetical protein